MQLENLRNRHRLSQSALARLLGVTRQTVSNWEDGLSSPDLRRAVRMAEIFGVTLDELATKSTPEPAEVAGV